MFVYENLNRRVVEFLREEILWSGRLRQGQHIQEVEIAERLGISRAPVREALRELEHEGLVEYVPRKGTYVASFDKDDFVEIVDIRFTLESRVYESIIRNRRLNEEDFRKLRSIIDVMVGLARGEAAQDEKTAAVAEQDVKFHRYLWEKSGRKWSYKILTNLYYQLRLAMKEDWIRETDILQDMEKSAAMHYDIVDSLEAGDLEGAKEVLLHHIYALSSESSGAHFDAGLKGALYDSAAHRKGS
jgi:DNA-binding GntR family transcriptional regulator